MVVPGDVRPKWPGGLQFFYTTIRLRVNCCVRRILYVLTIFTVGRSVIYNNLGVPGTCSFDRGNEKISVIFLLRKRLTTVLRMYGLFVFKKYGGSEHNFVASASPIYITKTGYIYMYVYIYVDVFRCSLRSV